MNQRKIETILLIVLFSTVFTRKAQAQHFTEHNSTYYSSAYNIIVQADSDATGSEGILFEAGKSNSVAMFNVDNATFVKPGIFSSGLSSNQIRIGVNSSPTNVGLHLLRKHVRVDSGEYQSWGHLVLHPDTDGSGDDIISFRNSENQQIAKIQDGVFTLFGENRLESSGNLTFRSGTNSIENDIIYFRNGNNSEMASLQDGFFKLQGVSKISANNISTSNLESEGILNLKGSAISFKKEDGTQQALLKDGILSINQIRLRVTSFPDYVFAKDYQLMPLEKVASYIKEHKHLPNMPSEAEVVKEGMNIGQVNTVLVEKVEELTLYTIEQDKQIRLLLKRLATLEKKIKSYK